MLLTNKMPETEAEERLQYYEWKAQQAEKEKEKKAKEGIKAFLASYNALLGLGLSEDHAITILTTIANAASEDKK